ncbi:homeobox protein SEBOX [Rhinophrynus dorsalis]
MENTFRSEYLLNKEHVLPGWTSQDNVPVAGAGIPGKQQEAEPLVKGTPPGQRKRKRTLYSKWQQVELESVFAVVPYPDISTREHLAKIIRLPESKVQVWFQNRRARKNKSGKLDRSLYKRGSSFCTPLLRLHSRCPPQSYSQRDPLATRPYPPNQTVHHGSSVHQVNATQPSLYHPFPEPSPPESQQYLGVEENIQYTYGQQGIQWENLTHNTTSPGYDYEPALYDAQLMELEKYMSSSQMPYLEMFPHAMNDSGSQTSLGYISDLIYNAAILTNVGEC